MGRKSKTTEEKKGKISITISEKYYNQMIEGDINKSQLINWLLEQYFNLVRNGK